MAAPAGVITITAPLGFRNEPEDHLVYGMVDSILQVTEDDETNNVSTPLAENQVTPAATPTPSPTPGVDGSDMIRGIVRSFVDDNWVRQYRAQVTIINEVTTLQVGAMESRADGSYQFNGLAVGNPYTN